MLLYMTRAIDGTKRSDGLTLMSLERFFANNAHSEMSGGIFVMDLEGFLNCRI